MARPERQMAAPAMAWVKRSRRPSFAKDTPHAVSITMVSMVPMVTIEKTAATRNVPNMLLSAAGYISSGIRGSHGPNTKIVNNIHGVRFAFLSS